jgi:endonuclease YncB( thermonuclease family)
MLLASHLHIKSVKLLIIALAAMILMQGAAYGIAPVRISELGKNYLIISEVELNPVGLDTDNEWIEIYNPHDFAADVSGWVIATAPPNAHSYKVPDGTIIEAFAYHVFKLPAIFFDNQDEVVGLADSRGGVVAWTQPLSDLKEDTSTMQFVLLRNKWAMATGTPGSGYMEGKEPQPQEQEVKGTPVEKGPLLSKVSVVVKQTKKVTLMAFRNSGDEPLLSIKITAVDASVRFVKSKGWEREKVDASTVVLKSVDRPLLPNTSVIIILLTDNPTLNYGWSVYDKDNRELASSMPPKTPSASPVPSPAKSESSESEPSKYAPSEGLPTSEIYCNGSASCLDGVVSKIVDGDTLDVTVFTTTVRIRLALVDTPEKGKPLYGEAVKFAANVCPNGSPVLVDEDDGQTEGSFDRMIAKVFCGNRVLNAELLNAGLAIIDTRFCETSEFTHEEWAKSNGC